MELIKLTEKNSNYDALIIPFGSELETTECIPEEAKVPVKAAIEAGFFKGEDGEIYKLSMLAEGKIQNIVLVGLGNKDRINNRSLFIAFSKAYSACKKMKARIIRVVLDNAKEYIEDYDVVEKICEGTLLADYEFNEYKSEVKPSTIERVEFDTTYDRFDEALAEAKVCAESTILARDLINQPPAFMTPAQLAEEAKNVGEECNIEVMIIHKPEAEELGMNAFLAVGKGSVNSPKVIVMKYFGDKDNEDIIGLIGKGVMYDSGGYCLKPSASLHTMHGDMSGAAAVIGAIRAIAKMGLKANVVGVIAACENRISGEAYLPGDILKSMSGKYIEMNNSDAEGRLTLADAITYAIREQKVTKVIDIATLTGAVKMALGNKTAGIISNDEELVRFAQEASEIACEKVWRLPADKELRHVLNSSIADLKNSAIGTTVGGGTILGGLFIQEFVEDKPWLHIDIAGTNWTHEDLPYCPKGGIGFGTSLLYNIVKLMSK